MVKYRFAAQTEYVNHDNEGHSITSTQKNIWGIEINDGKDSYILHNNDAPGVGNNIRLCR